MIVVIDNVCEHVEDQNNRESRKLSLILLWEITKGVSGSSELLTNAPDR